MQFRLQFRRYRLPFRVTVRTAHGPWLEREGVILRLEDATEGSSGAIGFGEAAPIPWFGTETVDDVEAGCRALGEWVDERAFETVPVRLACLRHALASAVAECRVQNRSTETSGAPSAVSAQTGTSAPLGVAALLPAGRGALAQIAPKLEAGFRVFKWKVGVGDLADELALLDDVCAELPDGARLRLDANGAWDRRRAERWLERCAERPIEFVEQPCFASAAEGETRQRRVDDVLLGLAGDYPTPIALDESVIGDGDLERWIAAGWPGVYVIKPALFGDVSGALARLERAKSDVVFSSALETAVGAKSALRAAFVWAAGRSNSPAATQEPDGEAAAKNAERRRRRALGFGVWPLFADARFDGPFAAPYLRFEDVETIDPQRTWNALS